MKSVSAEEAVAMIPNGATVMVGGFMGVGAPERLLDELVRQKKGQLSIIANDAAVPGRGSASCSMLRWWRTSWRAISGSIRRLRSR